MINQNARQKLSLKAYYKYASLCLHVVLDTTGSTFLPLISNLHGLVDALIMQLLTTGLNMRNSSHSFFTVCLASFSDLELTTIFSILADLIDWTFEYPPLTTRSRCIVSPSGSLTYGLFSIITRTIYFANRFACGLQLKYVLDLPKVLIMFP